MKLSSLFTLTICLIAFSSCQEAKKKVTAEAPTITLIEQKIEITDPEFLSSFNYPKLREFVKSDGSSVLYFFDNLLKSIIFIDELQLTTTHRIALNREGPNGIRSPKDAYILSETEIAVVESSAISIIDHHGNLLRKASRPSNGGFENIFFAFRGSNTHFTQDDSTLFIINNPLSRNDIDFMSKEPLVSSFDLKSMKYEMTKTPLPDKFRFDNAYYDMTNLPYVTPYENKIYLNFRVDKNIFEYTLSTNDLGEIALESKYADPMAPPSDEAKFSVREKAFEDLSNTQTFLDPIITDNYIYRPHSRARNPEINPQHEMYLSVYDKSFQLLLEVNLKEFGLLGLPFRYQNQIAFIKMDPIVEGKLIIHLFKAQKANPK